MTPPYLSKVKLSAVIDYVSSRNLAEVSNDTFLKNNFSGADAGLAVNSLKFLGFIDDAGKSTELMTKLRLTGDARKQAFEKIVKDAYKKLFDVVPAPQDLPLDQLISDLRIQYDLSKRVADSAAPALVKLMEYAGLKEETAVRKFTPSDKPKKPKETPQKQDKKDKDALETGRDYDFHIPIVEGKMYIEIPNEVHHLSLTDDDLNNDLRALVKQAHEFAKKYIPKDETSDPQRSEES